MPTAPVPAKRSRNREPGSLGRMMSKSDCLMRPEMGRTPLSLGTESSFLPRAEPAMILTPIL